TYRNADFRGTVFNQTSRSHIGEAVQDKCSAAPAGATGGSCFSRLVPGLERKQLHHRHRSACRRRPGVGLTSRLAGTRAAMSKLMVVTGASRGICRAAARGDKGCSVVGVARTRTETVRRGERVSQR